MYTLHPRAASAQTVGASVACCARRSVLNQVMYDYDLEERKMKGSLRDWRKALRTPATYRVGNAVTLQPRFIFLVAICGIFLLVMFYCNWWPSGQTHPIQNWTSVLRPYNATYPLTPPIVSGDVVTFRIGIVTDLDTNSKSTSQANTFHSYFKKGTLTYDPVQKQVTVKWDSQPPTLLSSTYSHKGRGMELSELIIQHLTWVNQFKVIRSSINIEWPGYMIHESGVWSSFTEKWHFLPRRCSHSSYNETRDEVMGCNYLITADASFNHVEAVMFIPGSKDTAIVALKTTEFEGKTATYISAFRTDGTVLLHDTFVESLKYEGLEFI
ncbi:hypothetical protein MSG28_004240 [Choristoneura fumiferana]|uniref:Uncharacterized protein n=1 Tax=Choristoneura fumiferana TaxID=7141 RepID=A0ACC0KHY4_CHOFU|nr:hypothetical protein MSG28_004240 [Choristoneura fumiferana]